MAMMSPMTAAYGMPQQMMPGMMQMQPQMMQAQMQPQQMMMPQQMMGGMSPYGGMYGQQPVYFNSMSQLPPGAIPVSQNMLAQALGQPGAQVVEQPSTISRVLKGAGLGAAAGAAFGLIPFLPLGLFSGAIVGAGVGAAIALLRKPRQGEFHTMTPEQQQAQAQAEMIASTPPGARSASLTADGSTNSSGQRQPVVMGPEMRRKWAAKVRAEKAAEAKAAAAK